MIRNAEGIETYDIDEHAFEPCNKQPGISAVLCVKDDAEWISLSLASIMGWVDEIIIVVHGQQRDNTREIALGFATWAIRTGLPVKVFSYPFELYPVGPGHDQVPERSATARSWLFNWAVSQVSHQHVLMWRADMVAFDDLGFEAHTTIKGFNKLAMRFRGIDIVGPDLIHQAKQPWTPCETRLFSLMAGVPFRTGKYREELDVERFGDRVRMRHAMSYLSFTWAKSEESRTSAWPQGWRGIEHFAGLARTKVSGDEYRGRWPYSLRHRVGLERYAQSWERPSASAAERPRAA